MSAVGSVDVDALQQRDAQGFDLEAACAVEGLLVLDVACDLLGREHPKHHVRRVKVHLMHTRASADDRAGGKKVGGLAA